MKFETISPNGVSITLGSSQDGDTNKVASPKALMLSSLAVCSGLDVVSILEKMKVNLEDSVQAESIFKELEFRNIAKRLYNNEDLNQNEESIIRNKEVKKDISGSGQIDIFSLEESKLQENTQQKLRAENHRICRSINEFQDFLEKYALEKKVSFQITVSSLSKQDKIIGVSLTFTNDFALYIPLDGKLVLETSDYITATAGTNSVLKILVSVLETANA